MIYEPPSDPEPIEVDTSETAQEDAPPALANQCNDETFVAFASLVTLLVANVHYGPGRGLWDADSGRFLVTYAPGRHSQAGDELVWENVLRKRFPAFHCTSFTNFILGWLRRDNEGYTHAGNEPQLNVLVTAGPEPRTYPNVGTWRGYGDICSLIDPDGSGAARHHVTKLEGLGDIVDMRELYARRAEMPTFVVFMQSTLNHGSWNTWHHTGLLVFRDGRMYRIAADGYTANHVYSADPMRWNEITEANVGNFDACVFRVYGVNTNADGSYGDTSRPIAEVAFE